MNAPDRILIVARWFMFGVLTALVPILLNGLFMHSGTGSSTANLYALWLRNLGDGNLVLVACSICGSALGSLFGVESRNKIAHTALAGFTLSILMICIGFYGFLVRATSVQFGFAAATSLILFIVAIVLAIIAILLARESL
jgi:hypothetical protein